MRAAFDTNLLAYAEGAGDDARIAQAARVVAACVGPDGAFEIVVPAQVLGELFNVLTRKLRRPAPQAQTDVQRWADTFAVAEAPWPVFQGAVDLSVAHGLPIWDALILNVAAAQGCRLLLSEDFQEGFTWRGVTVVNPFAIQQHPLIDGFLPPAA